MISIARNKKLLITVLLHISAVLAEPIENETENMPPNKNSYGFQKDHTADQDNERKKDLSVYYSYYYLPEQTAFGLVHDYSSTVSLTSPPHMSISPIPAQTEKYQSTEDTLHGTEIKDYCDCSNVNHNCTSFSFGDKCYSQLKCLPMVSSPSPMFVYNDYSGCIGATYAKNNDLSPSSNQHACATQTVTFGSVESSFLLPPEISVKENLIMSGRIEIASKTNADYDVPQPFEIKSHPSVIQGTQTEDLKLTDLEVD